MRTLSLTLLWTATLAGQSQPVQVSGSVGYATFIDESDQGHVAMGGAARFYVSRRNAVEPEVQYLYRDASDKDLLLQVNYVRDFGPAARGRRTIPYAIVGAGWLWGFRPRFTESTGTASGGFGVRVFPGGGGFFLSPEVRIGTEPILRAQVGFGWARR